MFKEQSKFEREILFFDLEFYVPPQDREGEGYSMRFNPNREGHSILGGVFSRYNPQKDNWGNVKLVNIWIWDYESEKELLISILDYFKESWYNQKNKNDLELDVCGIGISKIDLPTLYIRCEYLGVDTKENLFNILFKSQHIELNCVAIPFFNRTYQLHPISANGICRRFGISTKKPSGMEVWGMYDNGDHNSIIQRTNGEVKDCLKVFHLLTKQIIKKGSFSSR